MTIILWAADETVYNPFTNKLDYVRNTAEIAPEDADYLVGTANDTLTAEIVVGTSPGGELGGTWASPTVDTIHSGSAHHDAVTLGADADVLLGLTTQQVDLDSQNANVIFGGPASGAAADPTFRAIVDDDVPDNITITETQDAFKTITGITNDVVADSTTDSVTFTGAGIVTVVGTTATDTVTFTGTEVDPSVDTADEIEAILTNDNMDFGTGTLGSGAFTATGGDIKATDTGENFLYLTSDSDQDSADTDCGILLGIDNDQWKADFRYDQGLDALTLNYYGAGGLKIDSSGNLSTTGTLGAGAITGTSLTDGTTTIDDGNYTSVGNITGTDVDISAGTGSYSSTGAMSADGYTLNLVSKTANYTLTASDDIVLGDTNAFTLTLPAASGIAGKVYTIKKINTEYDDALTIDGNASETIDGATTYDLYTVNSGIAIVSDGSNWQIIGSF